MVKVISGGRATLSNLTHSMNKDSHLGESEQKLMVSGFVCPDGSCALSSEVRRGMPIFSQDGREVGKVAALLLNAENHQATHILLSRLPQEEGYWLVPLDKIAGITAGSVWLSISSENVVKSLPQWHSI